MSRRAADGSAPGEPPPADPVRARLTAAFPLVAGHPDVAGVLRDADLLALLGPALAAPFREAGVTAVCAPEARGPILGALVARELGAGLVLLRKEARNHPGADRTIVSDPTWRGRPERFLARSFDLGPTDVVLAVDDWITTGSTLRAVRRAVTDAGARYAGAAVLVDKADPSTLRELAVHRLVAFTDLV